MHLDHGTRSCCAGTMYDVDTHVPAPTHVAGLGQLERPLGTRVDVLIAAHHGDEQMLELLLESLAAFWPFEELSPCGESNNCKLSRIRIM